MKRARAVTGATAVGCAMLLSALHCPGQEVNDKTVRLWHRDDLLVQLDSLTKAVCELRRSPPHQLPDNWLCPPPEVDPDGYRPPGSDGNP